MRVKSGKIRLSASDLSNHLGCKHLTNLDLSLAQGEIDPPRRYGSEKVMLEVLQERGERHEAEYIEYLRESDPGINAVSFLDGEGSMTSTRTAMRGGADIIVQPTLASGRWTGRADILRRTREPSELGDWSYEVIDTKLARQTRAGTVLQLCLYSDIVSEIQGRVPSRMCVVSPGIEDEEPFKTEQFRVNDYLAYYRLIRNRLELAVEEEPDTYPEPVPQCDICRWRIECNIRRRKDDHLSLVAGLPTLHQRQVRDWDIPTLAAFGREPIPLRHSPKRGSLESYVRGREQARAQLEGRIRGEPYHELLPREPDMGLARLPEPSPGDVFFDIEGDAFVGTGGFEYLFGWAELDEDGEPEYRHIWAFEPGADAAGFQAGERAVFEAFIDEVTARWETHPDMHVYHFAPYEPGAMKRLMGRYATREDEVDRMLRAGLFVDLHAVTRQGVRASVERYSIKDLEQFYGFERGADLHEANDNRHALELSLETERPQDVTEEMRRVVQEYNRDDCVSAARLRDWLEGLRAELVKQGEDTPRPAPVEDADPSKELTERQERVAAITERLLRDVPTERRDRSDEQQARWLLAHILDWHRREAKAQWWERYRLGDLDEAQLLDEKAGIAGMTFMDRDGGTDRAPIHRYRYAPQDTTAARGNDLIERGGGVIGSIADIDIRARIVSVKKRVAAADCHPSAVFAFDNPPRVEMLQDSLLRLGEWVAVHGMDAPGKYRAARDLLLGLAPRLSPAPDAGQPLKANGEEALDAARRMATQLDGGVLAIQGPPGTGKTYTGARMITELVRASRKVGVTANSHKVIRNLLTSVENAAEEEDLDIRCIQKVSATGDGEENENITLTNENANVFAALAEGEAQVAAGTAWLWSRPEFAESVDTLFVDEAGQMSLANVLAMAPAAKNVVLLGDPQQLEQPQQGSHPEGADASALEHLLGDRKTIRDDRGLFLPETRRLHPSLCEFTSELFYDNHLKPRPNLAKQAIAGTPSMDGAGLWFAPVEHENNQSSSDEEAERVAELHRMLLGGGVSWTDQEGCRKHLINNDVMIIAPYNAHVSKVSERLPDARIGTVDKFQGQQAPVVIYSMATSSPEDAPRGMEFLFSLNRLNVATSRARCASILVASPRLFEPECRTPRQMQLANALCRYRELASTL